MRIVLRRLLAALIFISILSTDLFAQDRAEGKIVTKIEIEGNRKIKERKIRSAIKTRVGERYRGDVVDQDVGRIWALGYFQDINVRAEPEAKVRRYTKTVLQKYGYSVLAAATVGDALGLGKTAEVDLLISATSLPETSGKELAEKIRDMQPGLRVLLITDTTEQESSITAHAINKPFTSEALLRKIRKILG